MNPGVFPETASLSAAVFASKSARIGWPSRPATRWNRETLSVGSRPLPQTTRTAPRPDQCRVLLGDAPELVRIDEVRLRVNGDQHLVDVGRNPIFAPPADHFGLHYSAWADQSV